MRGRNGFSLVETSVVLAVAATLVALATPAFQRLQRQAWLAQAARGLHAALHAARAQAASRGLPVVLCQTDAGGRCSAGGSIGAGWQLFAKQSQVGGSSLESGDTLLAVERLPAPLQLTASRSAVTYWPQPHAAATSTFLFCDPAGIARPRAVIISQTGRPRVSEVAADGGALLCP